MISTDPHCRCGRGPSDICLVVHCCQSERTANALGCLCRVWRRCCSTHNSSPQSRLRSAATAMTGAQFEIRIDGAPRTYRDRKDFAIGEKAQHGRGQRPAKRRRDCGGSSAGVSDGTQAPPDRPRLRIDKDRPDYTVFTGEWDVGRIYETRGGTEKTRGRPLDDRNGPMTH